MEPKYSQDIEVVAEYTDYQNEAKPIDRATLEAWGKDQDATARRLAEWNALDEQERKVDSGDE